MSEKHSVTCPDCGKMYRDFAPEGDPICQCAEKSVRAMKDEITRPRPAMTAVSDETGRDAIDELIEMVASGRFYEDYDASLALLRRARKAHAAPVTQEPYAFVHDHGNEIVRAHLLKTMLPAAAAKYTKPLYEAPVAQEPWVCGTCGDGDVPEKFRVFGSCYRCAAQRSIDKRNRQIERLKAAPPATPAGVGADEIADAITRAKDLIAYAVKTRRLGVRQATGNDVLHRLAHVQHAAAKYKTALEKIAAYDDTGANARLKATGSYALFDEPGSVQTAREALG